MVNFYDECLKNRQPSSDERSESSPVAQPHKEGGCPDFNDKRKWVKDS